MLYGIYTHPLYLPLSLPSCLATCLQPVATCPVACFCYVSTSPHLSLSAQSPLNILPLPLPTHSPSTLLPHLPPPTPTPTHPHPSGFAQAWRRAGDALGELRQFHSAVEYYEVATRLDNSLVDSLLPAIERMKVLERLVDNAESKGWSPEAIWALLDE